MTKQFSTTSRAALIVALTMLPVAATAQAVSEDVLTVIDLNEKSEQTESNLREVIARAAGTLADQAVALNRNGHDLIKCRAENGLTDGVQASQDKLADIISCHVTEAVATGRVLAEMTDTVRSISDQSGKAASVYGDLAASTETTKANYLNRARERRMELEKTVIEARSMATTVANPDAELSQDIQLRAVQLYTQSRMLENEAASMDRRASSVDRQRDVYVSAQRALHGIQRDTLAVASNWEVQGQAQELYVSEVQLAASTKQLESELSYLSAEVSNLNEVIAGFDELFSTDLARPEMVIDGPLPAAPEQIGTVSDEMRNWFASLADETVTQ